MNITKTYIGPFLRVQKFPASDFCGSSISDRLSLPYWDEKNLFLVGDFFGLSFTSNDVGVFSLPEKPNEDIHNFTKTHREDIDWMRSQDALVFIEYGVLSWKIIH